MATPNGITLTRIKVLTSHVGHGRYLDTCEPFGEIARRPEIPSPYAYSASHLVYKTWLGEPIIIVETSHKRYEVFRVDGGPILPIEQEGDCNFWFHEGRCGLPWHATGGHVATTAQAA